MTRKDNNHRPVTPEAAGSSPVHRAGIVQETVPGSQSNQPAVTNAVTSWLVAVLLALFIGAFTSGCYGRASVETCTAKHITDGRGGPGSYERCLAQYHCRIGHGPCPTKRSVWSVAIPVAIGVAVARNSQPQPQPRVVPTYYAPTTYVAPAYVQSRPLDYYCYKIGKVTQCRVTGTGR